jgi:hypothetical protein
MHGKTTIKKKLYRHSFLTLALDGGELEIL